MSLRIGRKTYRASISPILHNLMEQYVRDLPALAFEDIRSGVLIEAKAKRMDAAANVESFCEEILAYLHERTSKEVVLPLLTLLEGPFNESAYSAEDSIFEVESDLTEILCAACAKQLPVALNTFLLSGREDAIQQVLNEFLTDDLIRGQTLNFFETFAAASVTD